MIGGSLKGMEEVLLLLSALEKTLKISLGEYLKKSSLRYRWAMAITAMKLDERNTCT